MDEPALDGLEVVYESNSGLNHTLRIDGHSFVYDPEFDKWAWERWHEGRYVPLYLTADLIHEMMLSGSHRVTVWGDENE